MSMLIKVMIIAVLAIIIILSELIALYLRKRKFVKGKPTVALIVRRDFLVKPEEYIENIKFEESCSLIETNLNHQQIINDIT